MGNCLPKFKRRNKVHPGRTASIKKKIETNVSEVLSRSSASVSIRSLTSSEEDNASVESLIFKKDDNIMDELIEKEQEPIVKKPVFFQVDFVQGMRKLPSRLAVRIDKKVEEQKSSQMVLNDEDELMMNEIMEEVETKQKLERLREQLTAAQNLRELHLQSVRDKARGMASRPQTRAGRYGDGAYGGGVDKG